MVNGEAPATARAVHAAGVPVLLRAGLVHVVDGVGQIADGELYLGS